MKNIPVLSFLTRYWLLILLMIASVLACLNDRIFTALGALIYVPAVSSVAIIVTLFIRHLYFRSTIDQDASDGTFSREWRELTAWQRLALTIALTASLFLGVCLIAASMGK